MSVRTRWAGYGRPAAEALRSAVAEAKADGPLAPVTVVVPSNHVGVASRRLLASGALGAVTVRGNGIAAVGFLTVYRLGELLGAAALAGDGRRPVSTPVIGAALRAALAERPGVFGPVATHPATETALVAAYRELRDLSPAALDTLARQSPRARDVVRLQREARRRLEGGWYDEEDLLDAAAAALGAASGDPYGLGSVIVYLPQRISRHGGALLRCVAEHRRVEIIAGRTGVPAADAEVVASVRRIDDSPGLPPPEPSGTTDRDRAKSRDPSRTRILTASDADDEVRCALRHVMDAMRNGTPLDRIAILFAAPEPYGRLVHEHLVAAGIPANGTSIMPLGARVAGRTLLGLLSLPGSDFRRDELFAWLTGAGVLDHGRPVPVVAWERLSRDAGVVARREHWDRLLARLADSLDEEAARGDEDPDGSNWRPGRAREAAAQARDMRDFVLGLIDDLERARSTPKPWPEWASWSRYHLERLLGGEHRRDGWPEPERRAAERVERALDRLACLEEMEGPVDLGVFTRTLELELDTDLGRVGRMGQGVLAAPIGMGVGLDLELVVVLGLAEGVFPARALDDSLLPDRERSVLGDDLPLRSGGVERQHRQLLAAIDSSSRHLLCVPRGDLRGSKERIPCRWVLDAASTLAGRTLYSEDLVGASPMDAPWLEHVASFDAGLRAVTFPVSDQEYRLRALLADQTAVHTAPASAADRVLAAGAEVIRSRRSRRFTRFDGNLADVAVPSPVDGITSATRIEHWVSCPFGFLLHEILGVDEVENPEAELEITPLTRGSLVHDALERFIAEVLARPEADQPQPTQPWSEADRNRMVEIGEQFCEEYEGRGVTGRLVFWERDRRRLLEELLRVLVLDDAHRACHGTRPLAAELAFGFGDPPAGTIEIPPVVIPLPDGRSLRFRGRADRVDVGTDGTVHVVDYKTGKSNRYRSLSEDDPDQGGQRFQLVVYGQAARAMRHDPDASVRAEYWFVSSKGEFRRIGYSVTRDVLVRAGRSLGLIVAGIEHGVFTPYPTAQSTKPFVDCAFCDPDGLGVVDLRRAFERKLSDPALAGFLALVAPDTDLGSPDA